MVFVKILLVFILPFALKMGKLKNVDKITLQRMAGGFADGIQELQR